MPLAPIRILIADDHPVWRRGIRDLLSAEADIEVVAEAADGQEALRLIRSARLDVALLDMEMPGVTGVEVARMVNAEGLPVRLLALSSYDDAAYVTALLKNGASGYITKDKPPELIVEAVRAVARGEGRWFVTPTTVEDPAAVLTEREREVIRLLAMGQANHEIAAALFISENTVRSHLANAYAKIGAATAREAVAWAWKTGFVRGEE
ncbi:response regulator transcription factor [Roseibium sp.]|uniref:response regulator transcription factor n=1 Tax=Roseibium sp. TaxID=1936156 RepID=UPI0032982C1A